MYSRARPPPSHYPGHSDGSHPKPGCQVDPPPPATLHWVDCELFARHWHRTAATFSGGATSERIVLDGLGQKFQDLREVTGDLGNVDEFCRWNLNEITHDIPRHILDHFGILRAGSIPNSLNGIMASLQ